jgi:hypothetical protein
MSSISRLFGRPLSLLTLSGSASEAVTQKLMDCRLRAGKEGLQLDLRPLLTTVRNATLMVFVPVDPEPFPTSREEFAIPACKAVTDFEAVDRRNRIC